MGAGHANPVPPYCLPLPVLTGLYQLDVLPAGCRFDDYQNDSVTALKPLKETQSTDPKQWPGLILSSPNTRLLAAPNTPAL